MKVELKSVIESFWHLPSAILGAAGVKAWEACLRRWRQRLTQKEKRILLCAHENYGSLEWKQDREGAVTLPFKLMGRTQPLQNMDDMNAPPVRDYVFEEHGEIGALITKGFMEVADNGYRRRLTHEGYKKVEAIKRSIGIADGNRISMFVVLDEWHRTGSIPNWKTAWWKRRQN